MASSPIVTSDSPTNLRSFKQRYCALRRIAPSAFECAVFLECVPLHVLFVAVAFMHPHSARFSRERNALQGLGEAHTLGDFERTYDTILSSEFGTRPTGFAQPRLSRRRLRRLAEACFAEGFADPS